MPVPGNRSLPDWKPPAQLIADFWAYRDLPPEWKYDNWGKVVVLHDQEVAAIESDVSVALDFAVRRFGWGNTMVHRVGDEATRRYTTSSSIGVPSDSEGAFIQEVVLGWPKAVAAEYERRNETPPAPVATDAFLDSVANCSAIALTVERGLHLPPVSMAFREPAPLGEVPYYPVYLIRIVPVARTRSGMPPDFDPWFVIGGPLAWPYACVLGNDIRDEAQKEFLG